MADGRDLMEEVREIIMDLSSKTDDLEATYPESTLAELKSYLEEADKWVKLCRKKVWLRGLEGTEKAQACLDTANKLQDSWEQPAVAVEAAADLASKLDSLARLIATKSQVLT